MDNVAEELSGIKAVLEKMLKVMETPKNRTTNILETIMLIVGILSVIHIADVVRQWFIGD
jgi:hypothetical protein